MDSIRYEREALFASNGSVHVLWRDFVGTNTLVGGRIGHIVMSRLESLQAKLTDDRRVLHALLSDGDGRGAARKPPGDAN